MLRCLLQLRLAATKARLQKAYDRDRSEERRPLLPRTVDQPIGEGAHFYLMDSRRLGNLFDPLRMTFSCLVLRLSTTLETMMTTLTGILYLLS
jgi:hypothetical protein